MKLAAKRLGLLALKMAIGPVGTMIKKRVVLAALVAASMISAPSRAAFITNATSVSGPGGFGFAVSNAMTSIGAAYLDYTSVNPLTVAFGVDGGAFTAVILEGGTDGNQGNGGEAANSTGTAWTSFTIQISGIAGATIVAGSAVDQSGLLPTVTENSTDTMVTFSGGTIPSNGANALRLIFGVSIPGSAAGNLDVTETPNLPMVSVPEPSSVILVGLGFVGVAARVYRRRRSLA